MKKLIIFDCDGTLVDSEIIACRVFPEVWSNMGVPMTQDFFLCNFVGVGSDAAIVKETRARLSAVALETASKRFNEEIRKSLQPVKGMRELLEQLSHPVCVASNSSAEYVRDALSITALDRFFGQRVFSARQVSNPKPAPDLFLHAARDLGFFSSQCIVVEDSVTGIQAAKNAGMTVIGFMGGLHFNEVVRKRLTEAQADYYCSDGIELKKLIS